MSVAAALVRYRQHWTFDMKTRSTRADRLIGQMLEVLAATGIPVEKEPVRTRRRIAEAALAVAGISKSFSEAHSSDDGCFLTTRQIIAFENEKFGAPIRQAPTMMSAVVI